jgi:hypothetical protein
MMNPEIKQLWLDALRSGKYEQGKLMLKPTESSYCCLGVLCEIAQERNIGEYIPSEEHRGFTFKHKDSDDCYDYYYEDSELPYIVKQWAGLDNENPKVTMNERNIKEGYKGIIQSEKVLTLAELNDNFGYTFTDLANIIEEQL